MFCNLCARSYSNFGRDRSTRFLLFMLILAGPVICPSRAQGTTTGSLVLTATDPDGTNTGTARLGIAVNLVATRVNLPISTRVWTLQGAGTLVPNGAANYNMAAVYTPPKVMPANPSVTITVATSVNPIVSTTYTLTLVNPVPVIQNSSPGQAV